MTATTRELVLLAMANGIDTPRQIAEAVRLELRPVQNAIARLRTEGLVERDGFRSRIASVERFVEHTRAGSVSIVEHRAGAS